MVDNTCPACAGSSLTQFYEIPAIPVHSVLQMYTRESAVGYRRANLSLAFCRSCGFIFNSIFDPSVHEYSADYEETQGYSEAFNSFHRALARDLVERHNLRGRRVIEIGCGKGEFLLLLCRIGANKGIGIDPAYVEGRLEMNETDQLQFIREFYSERSADLEADFVCCKMTLEHIHTPAELITALHKSLRDRLDTVVFFQVPDVTRVLSELAFWDVYYEHCSYFSAGSLAQLFRSRGFEVTNVDTTYGGQYLTIEAKPSATGAYELASTEEDVDGLADLVERFSRLVPGQIELWRELLMRSRDRGLRVVLWGSGSKAVAFLHAVDTINCIEHVVDINPHRQGTFIAGKGQEIVAPEFLREYRPDIVIAMNPVYEQEIGKQLAEMGLRPTLLSAKRIDECLLDVIRSAPAARIAGTF
jgi:SAM-dependent methyltransferase